jgi:hypothetical protein
MLAQNQVRRSGMRELGRILKPLLIVAMSVSAMGKAGAHHSFAVFFDAESKVVKVTGIVKDFQFRNPHGVITLSVQEGSDTVIWRAETNSPSILRRRGWTADSLHVGDQVTVEGWPARDGTRYLRLRSAQLSDGRTIGLALIALNDVPAPIPRRPACGAT